MFVEMPEIYGCKEMTPNQQKAQEIVTKFNGDGACLSNTDETYLGTLIAAALDDVQQATHDRLVLRHVKDSLVVVQATFEEAAKIAEFHSGPSMQLAKKIRALGGKI